MEDGADRIKADQINTYLCISITKPLMSRLKSVLFEDAYVSK